jgi:hypothetical protein
MARVRTHARKIEKGNGTEKEAKQSKGTTAERSGKLKGNDS